jgi:nitrogen PTS system EIIA component
MRNEKFTGRVMSLNQLISRQTVNGHLNAQSKRQVLQILAEMAERQLGLEATEVLSRLTEREDQGSTGVGHGVAVPHAALKGLDHMVGLFIRLETPVEFGAIDGLPVDLVFALLAPENSGTEHLRALAKVSRLLRQADLRNQLRALESNDALFALLTHSADSNAA